MSNTTNNNKNTTQSNFDPKEDNAVKRFDHIQAILSNDNYLDDDTHLSDKLHAAKSKMDMVLNGLSYLFNNTGLGDFMTSDQHYAIIMAWIELEELIELREREHKKVWDMAFHGELRNKGGK